jgi:predicted kinase
MKLKIIKTVYTAVGLPASGKSYWWEMAVTKKLLPPPSSKRIHLDVIRGDLCGDVSDHSKDEIVNRVAISNLKNYLSNEMPIIYYDDLNIDRSRRLQINKISKEFGYKTTAIVFDTPLDVCRIRLDNSSKKIPLELLGNYSKMLKENPVDYDEGWDDIIVVKYE